jgi:predicted GNAT family N-acyltransferase
MKNLKIRLVKNKEELDAVFKIRKTVFVKEQNVPVSLEIEGYEKKSKHVIILLQGKPIGCSRIRTIGKKIKLERIAVLKKYRNKGIGKRLIKYLINYSKKENPEKI